MKTTVSELIKPMHIVDLQTIFELFNELEKSVKVRVYFNIDTYHYIINDDLNDFTLPDGEWRLLYRGLVLGFWRELNRKIEYSWRR